ncbi:hypothetical protein BGX23_000942 [Mortierella sp. AD031]|nr:hypothetical protein BGX23_000942 [Mortierella sp. AD031]
MQDALSLSEIRTHIGLFLIANKKDLITCMSVCKDWRTDFRRLLYRDLVLVNRTTGPILSPLQWRAFGIHTQSLTIEEPAVMQQGAPGGGGTRTGYGGRGGYGRSTGSGKINTVLRSSSYNLDGIQHCPNLLHLTALFCWTREDDEEDDNNDNGNGDNNDLENPGSLSSPSQPPALFRTSAALRLYHNTSWLVKSSNRILALLEYHPNLKSFHWISDSDMHMERLGRYLLSKQHRLVDLHLDSLAACVSELNQIIENCPSLRRLVLRSLHLVPTATWPDLGIVQEVTPSTASLSPVLLSPSSSSSATTPLDQPAPLQSILYLAQIQSLTLDRPQFLTQGVVKICGPALRNLELIDCALPPSFLRAVDRAKMEGTPLTLTPYVLEWICPQLTTFEHRRGSLMPEAFTHSLLASASKSIRSLSLVRLTLQPTLISDLIANNHCQQLTHFDLSGSERIKSTDLQWLLCNCPELIEFKGPAGVLWGEDLFQSSSTGKTWACQRIKKLQMLICLARPDSGLWETEKMFLGFPLWDAPPADSNLFLQVQRAVFEQIGQLTELEVLDLSGGYGIGQFLHEVPRGLPWTLEAGLDRLKNLTRMRELTVSGWENKMTRKEAQWFRQFWPELRSISTKNGAAFARRHQFDKPVSEELVVGWLAFQMCLHQEWPARFPDPQ